MASEASNEGDPMLDKISFEYAAELITKALAGIAIVIAGLMGLLRLVNKPIQQDIAEIKRLQTLRKGEIDDNAKAIRDASNRITALAGDVRDINTRMEAHFSDDAEQRRAERAAVACLKQLRDSGWKPWKYTEE